ncbi:energy transducer TonB [Pseudomonadales bacterium]|nr:energy transducer TonB [Pseudomonadales bacterium]
MRSLSALDSDRMGFALFLAVVLHGILILGISFSQEPSETPSRVLDVTLTRVPSTPRPDQFDYLSDQNQHGKPLAEKPEAGAAVRAVSERAVKDSSAAQTDPNAFESTQAVLNRAPTAFQRLITDVSQFRRAQNSEALMPREPSRVRRLSQVNAAASPDAFYLRSWQRKIEAVGNLNYPEAARRGGIYGSLRLMVAINANGSLKEVRVLQSSGEPILDQAAQNIIRLAEPFPPFSEALLKTTDVLEIVRTWQFRKNAGSVNVQP